MKTISIDLAAWLYLSGIEPSSFAAVKINGRSITEFTYDKTIPQLGNTIRAFEHAHVPVKAFSEARARMKDWRAHSQRKLDSAHRAYEDARWQAAQESLQRDHDRLLDDRRSR